MSTRAQQHEKSRLSLNLSFFEVGPWRVVPLIESTTVALSGERKTCPRKPSALSSQPNGKLCTHAVSDISLRSTAFDAGVGKGRTEEERTYRVPCGIDFVPVRSPRERVCVACHAGELGEGVLVLYVRSENPDLFPMDGYALLGS